MDKTETVSFRVTEKKREEIEVWAEKHGFTEADALRTMVNRALYDQVKLDEIKTDEELKNTLNDIEEQIEQLDKSWWERLFS